MDESRRAQCFLRLADGGLGFGSAELAREFAYLGSWALTLKDFAASVGAATWEGFRARCGPLPASLERAEAKLLQDSGSFVQPVHWAPG